MKPLVIAFEGLFSYWPAGFVRHGLLEPLALELPGVFDYSVHSWFWGNPKPSTRPLIIVGHSFGGPRAIRYAETSGPSVIAVVTLDPRMAPPPKPRYIPVYNFYRGGRMHGFPVEGANNFKLHESVSHTRVPTHPEVMDLMIRLLGGTP